MSENNKISIAIVDDHPIVIQGLKTLLETDHSYYIAGCFATGNSFTEFLREHEVNIALLDITLPDGSGIDFCRKIKRNWPDVKVLALSNLSERSIIAQMLHNGASGYLLKNLSARELLDCISNAASGQIVMSSEIREIMQQPEFSTLTNIPDLTKREKQILAMLASGRKSAQIAEELYISPLTVKTHRATLMQKFEVNNVVALINRAKECGLL